MSDYDSTQDTMEHIGKVREHIAACIDSLWFRAKVHDASKLLPPEKEAFDEMTPILSGLTYGSDEYKAGIARLGPALEHHYFVYAHHPEHYPDGVNGMSLLDVLEMLCDWKAASERHANGDIARSLRINRERFGIGEQLAAILENTAVELEWMEADPIVDRLANLRRSDIERRNAERQDGGLTAISHGSSAA